MMPLEKDLEGLRRGHFIGGKAEDLRDHAGFPVLAPETGACLGEAARGDASDVARAVASARGAFVNWANLAPGERESILLRTADILERRVEPLVHLVIEESGSTVTKAKNEVAYAASLLRTAAGEVRRLYGDTFPNDRSDRLSLVLREPLGVVAVISPFNSPLALLTKMCAFPLAAGNAVVAKPSEETPFVALELARAFHDAGAPPGTLNVVTGLGPEVGEALVRHHDVKGIAFTGSTRTGVRIGAAAMERMARVQLELGGKNAAIVLDDVDPVATAKILAQGAFFHAGQICMATSRILATPGIYPRLVEALAREAESLFLGSLRDEKTAYGPLIHAQSLAKVKAHVDEARGAGAQLVTGGNVRRGLVYEPTVLAAPSTTSAVWREETFGPVTCILPVSNTDEAVALANDSPYGLSACVLTERVSDAFTLARRLRAGSVHIGMHSFQSNAMAPIGGVGMSGLGKSGGKYSIEAFTELKWVSVELGTPPFLHAP